MTRGPTFSAAAVAALSLALLTSSAGVAQSGGAETTNDANDEAGESPEEEAPPTWLGVEIADDADTSSGAEFTRVLDGTPAAAAGLREGDVVLRVDGVEVDDLKSLKSELAPHGPGEEVTLSVSRDGEARDVDVTLEARPTKQELIEQRVVGTRAEGFALKSLGGGEPVEADELRGQPTVLEFWATWCYPCRRTAETMAKIVDEHGEAVRVLGVSAESARDLRVYRRENSPGYELRRDPERAAHGAFLVDTYPTVVVLDRDGRVEEVFRGAEHREAILELVDRLTSSSNSRSAPESK